jgi:ribosome biogenesis GTPase A
MTRAEGSPGTIQWYPGHIAKYERRLGEFLKLVDVVVEVLDARLPVASTNPRLENRIRNKPTLVILNKSDLADPAQSDRWRKHLTEGEHRAMLYDAKSAKGKERLIQHVLELGETAMQRMEARGRKRRPIRVLVAGMPNVGKSTLINSIVGRKKTKTGHRAGVTRETQWVRIHPQVELMDSPGVIPPYLESEETGMLLATVSSIGDAAFDEDAIARFLLNTIEEHYPGLLAAYYKLAPEQDLTLENIAEVRHYKLSGDQLDLLRTAQAMLTEFRHARFGRITLEHAPHHRKSASHPEAEEVPCEAPEDEAQQADLPAEI